MIFLVVAALVCALADSWELSSLIIITEDNSDATAGLGRAGSPAQSHYLLFFHFNDPNHTNDSFCCMVNIEIRNPYKIVIIRLLSPTLHLRDYMRLTVRGPYI